MLGYNHGAHGPALSSRRTISIVQRTLLVLVQQDFRASIVAVGGEVCRPVAA